MTITVPTLLFVAVVFLPPMAVMFWGLWSFLGYLEPRVVRWWLHRDGYSDEEIDSAMSNAALQREQFNDAASQFSRGEARHDR